MSPNRNTDNEWTFVFQNNKTTIISVLWSRQIIITSIINLISLPYSTRKRKESEGRVREKGRKRDKERELLAFVVIISPTNYRRKFVATNKLFIQCYIHVRYSLIILPENIFRVINVWNLLCLFRSNCIQINYFDQPPTTISVIFLSDDMSNLEQMIRKEVSIKLVYRETTMKTGKKREREIRKTRWDEAESIIFYTTIRTLIMSV